MSIPVHVIVHIYMTYLTLFPEVMKQGTSLFLSFLPCPRLSFGNFISVKKYNNFVFEMNEFTYYLG